MAYFAKTERAKKKKFSKEINDNNKKKFIFDQEKRELGFKSKKENLDIRFKKLFPNNIWLVDGFLTYPSDKQKYSEEEILFFKDYILYKIKNKGDDFLYIDTEKNSDKLDQANRSLNNFIAIEIGGRAAKEISLLKMSLVRAEKRHYGICEKNGGIVHPLRLYASPHATSNINKKQ